MKELIHQDDRYGMNWIEGNTEWGTVKATEGIEVQSKSEVCQDTIQEEYYFINKTDHPISIALKDISIYTPFQDSYADAQTCMKNRCHTHIWCGEETSFVMALRMGGEGPHLGLVLTAGSLGGYSVERDLSQISNDRGDFLMHPSPVCLLPGEQETIAWTLFWHEGKEDFYRKLGVYNSKYLYVNAKNYTVFEQEEIELQIEPVFSFCQNDISVERDGKQIDFSVSDNKIFVREQNAGCGEHHYLITVLGVRTHCHILVLPSVEELAGQRCRFIAQKQQCRNPGSGLDGTYLIYDNEEKKQFYDSEYDFNGGRERVGMGILMAKYLQNHCDTELSESLTDYIEYVERELFDTQTGIVYNDYHGDNSFKRLYNYPWMSLFYIELYKRNQKRDYLVYAYRALKSFYEQGGTGFYAIEVPLKELYTLLEKAGMEEEKAVLLTFFRQHSDCILANGFHYPAHEVNFEQSIVAPADALLLQMYEITGEEKYITGAKQQLDVLSLFSGFQPDYHLYETTIRHWDGYWFGKRRLYGDTFPHYWSALSANVFYDYAKISGDEMYLRRADACYRGVLSLFRADGSASCAYVYPVTVNGEDAEYYDPYANDQDWGLYFMLRYLENCE